MAKMVPFSKFERLRKDYLLLTKSFQDYAEDLNAQIDALKSHMASNMVSRNELDAADARIDELEAELNGTVQYCDELQDIACSHRILCQGAVHNN